MHCVKLAMPEPGEEHSGNCCIQGGCVHVSVGNRCQDGVLLLQVTSVTYVILELRTSASCDRLQ